MNREERKELAEDIEQQLDDELDFNLNYEIDDYHECGTSIVDIDIDISDCGEWPDDWEEQVEDVMEEIVGEWGGWYSWEGSCISVSIPDE